jgi:predicted nucleic acid-binding protein
MREGEESLLADANVLIDYLESDFQILSLASNHIGKAYVLREVLDEVRGLSVSKCNRHGLAVIETQTATAFAAGSMSGPLSFPDRLCLITCRERSMTCVTNDSALIRTCQESGITTRRGLNLMIELVGLGVLNRRKALTTARQMHQSNPNHINETVLALFEQMLEDRGSGRS